MPYNTSALPLKMETTGTTQLPLSRVKKIISHDPDIDLCSNNAAFVVTLAAEMLIQYLAEKGHDVARSERKPRRNIQYRDLSSAVAIHDNLEFLSDIVPKTVPYKVVREKKIASSKATNGERDVEAGQTTLDGGSRSVTNGVNGLTHEENANDGDDASMGDPNQQLEMEIQRHRISTGSIGEVMNGTDVEMGL